MTELRLNHCRLGDKGAIGLLRGLEINDRLIKLKLKSNMLTDEIV